ncbi:MAG TPA: YcxB family protein [Roseomonas sp.]|jgi:hypothetical protein
MDRAATITLTEQDFIASQRLHAWDYLRRRVLSWRFAVVWLVILLGLAVLFLQPGGWDMTTIAALAVAAIVLPIASILLAMLINRVFGPAAARRIFRQQKSLQQTVEYAWSDAGLKTRTARSESLVPWTDYWKWRQDATTLLLYHSDRLYQFVPKRALTPEQAADMVAVMERQRSGAGAVAASSASIGSQT